MYLHIYDQMKLEYNVTGATQNVIHWEKSFTIIDVFIICFCYLF